MPAGAPYTDAQRSQPAHPEGHPHLVELITREIDKGVEIVEAVRIDHGPRIELPLGARVAVEYEAGESLPVVVVAILAGKVRHIDREAI
jgi:hypothetical protein